MPTADELARSYAAAWMERNPDKRRALLSACCCDDIHYLEQGFDHAIVGIDALSHVIEEFQSEWPDGSEITVGPTTVIDEHHGFGRGGFVYTFPGEVRGYGTNFVQREGDRMKTIVVFVDPGPPPLPPLP